MVKERSAYSYKALEKFGGLCKIVRSMPQIALLARYVELGMFLTRKRTTIHQFRRETRYVLYAQSRYQSLVPSLQKFYP